MIQTRGEKIFQMFNYLFLALLSFTFLYPFWRVIALSLSEGIDASRGGIHFWPRVFTWDNYITIFSRSDILDAYVITISRTVVGTLLTIFLVSLMAYGLSKNRLRGRSAINLMLIFTMFFSGGLIPVYLLYRSLHLLNTFWIYIIPALYGAAFVFIFRSFFRSLPIELEESAQIDGANDLRIYFTIVFPLSMPIFATMSLFAAVGHWNDYLTAALYVTKQELTPLQNVLVKIMNINKTSGGGISSMFGASNINSETTRTITPQSIKMAVLVSVILPIMCVYPFLQKYFVKGIIVGSLKG